MLRKPSSLKPGSTIGISAPSSRLNKDTFEAGCAVLRDQGFTIYVHDQSHLEHGQIAGPATDRAAALTDLLLDPAIDAVVFSGGGHRAAEILPLLDWTALQKTEPKIMMGFSDITVLLHAFHARLGWATFYGPAVQAIGRTKDSHPDTWAHSRALLEGATPTYALRYDGKPIEGPVVAATLSLLPLLLDTDDLPDLTGSILCIEDINEEASSIDRLMLLLKRKGVLDKIAALVCGDFINVRDGGTRPFGFTVEEIIRHHAGDLPLAFDAPFGHGDALYALPIGVKARLRNNALTMLESGVI
jgi:muramoyltetrapeptide carboxypeptidase